MRSQAGIPDATPIAGRATVAAARTQGVVLAVLTSLNLAGGLAIQWYITGRLGAGLRTDALFAALALPQALLAVIASSFMTVLVPLVAGEDHPDFQRRAWTFTAATLAVFVVLAVVLTLLAPWWVPLVAPGLPAAGHRLAVQLARIQLIGMVWTSMAGILGAVGRARHRFIWVETAPAIGTAVAFPVLIVTLPAYGVHAAAWVQVLRIALHALLLAPGLGPFVGFSRDRRLLTDVARRLRPLVGGTAYFKSEPVLDRAISSFAPSGDLSIYYLCQQVCTAALQLTNNAFIAPAVPPLAGDAKSGDWQRFSERRRHTSTAALGIAFALSVALLAGLALVLGAGWLSPATAATARRGWYVLAALGGLLIGGPLAESFRSAFYATGETSIPVRIDVAVYTIGIGLKAAGFMAGGLVGLAVAASVQVTLGAVLLHRALGRTVRARATANAGTDASLRVHSPSDKASSASPS
jgi:putative peptidoglycan lipid II flippase